MADTPLEEPFCFELRAAGLSGLQVWSSDLIFFDVFFVSFFLFLSELSQFFFLYFFYYYLLLF